MEVTPPPNAWEPIVSLAKARELLVKEGETTMPKGARAQRDKIIATLGTLIDNELAITTGPMPETPGNGLDPVGKDAWAYVAERKLQPLQPVSEAPSAYGNLKRVFDEYSNLYQTGGILFWIRSSHALPHIKSSTIDDADAAAAIFMHRCMVQPRVTQWLDEVRASRDTLDATEQRNFALMERLWSESAGLDETLVGELSQAQATSYRTWEEAKPESDFSAWLPHFEEVVKLTRQKGEALGKVFGTCPYQTLLGGSSSNPGLSNDTVTRVFSDLRTKLPALIKEVTDKQAAEAPPLPLPPVPVDIQQRIAQRITRELGLEEQYARLDKSAHPFTIGQWKDVRITTRYKEKDMLPALMSVIHETGHALYSRGLPEKWKDQPVGEPQSAWVHETQSIFWEKQVASSREFMEFLSPVIKAELAKEGLKTDGPEWSPENLYKLVTRVKPSLIRTEADEVSYPAHVIVRHDLEQKLIDGTLLPKDVPAAWARGYRGLLGVEVPDHARGCMQDVHWPQGMLGYFPAYTFGALGAAQLMEKLKQELDVGERVKKGDFAPIGAWLTDRIHKHGARYDGEELIARATGKPLSAQAWLNHVQERYLDTKWQNRSNRRPSGPPELIRS